MNPLVHKGLNKKMQKFVKMKILFLVLLKVDF